MPSIKERKVAIIKKEILIQRGQRTYDISGIDVVSAKFMYRNEREAFKDLAPGDYTITGSSPNWQLVISNDTIINTSEAIQVCEIFDMTSSKYIVPFEADINTLVSKYNEAVQDLQRLWSYVRTNTFAADDLSISPILPQLNDGEFWVKSADGWIGYPIYDFASDIQALLDQLTAAKDSFLVELTNHKNSLKIELTSDMDIYFNEKRDEIDGMLGQVQSEINAFVTKTKTDLTNYMDSTKSEVKTYVDAAKASVDSTIAGWELEIETKANSEIGRVVTESDGQIVRIQDEAELQFKRYEDALNDLQTTAGIQKYEGVLLPNQNIVTLPVSWVVSEITMDVFLDGRIMPSSFYSIGGREITISMTFPYEVDVFIRQSLPSKIVLNEVSAMVEGIRSEGDVQSARLSNIVRDAEFIQRTYTLPAKETIIDLGSDWNGIERTITVYVEGILLSSESYRVASKRIQFNIPYSEDKSIIVVAKV